MPSTAAASPSTAASAEWEDCWEKILCLPIEPLPNNHLRREARRLVQQCRRRNGDNAWFAAQVTDAKLFVEEQLELDDDSLEWQRIDAALVGAWDGLADDDSV